LDAAVDRPAGCDGPLWRGAGGAQGQINKVIVLGFLKT